jgi:FlaA1/EpsC-like NDP-sugar epimerase
VSLDLETIRQKLEGKVLMITGAGGSIGSELARQVAEFHPRKLVLFERAENHLPAIDIELRTHFSNLKYVPAIGDILDVRTLREVVGEHRPDSIFHAAAYKHVPMMEKNCFQAIANNIFGSYNVALVAKQYGVADFLMISSDKAVNPTNIMGVTKRVAELVILALQDQQTRFVSVRFGNVLGSAGSVLPLFEEQIARGGPLTVTHPDARRYFMTIPEAVQLVLQASTMGAGGEIFVLDMGSPVLIADLAKNLARLSGLDPENDIKIVYTGLRPGEKLFEELHLNEEHVKPTSHSKIRVFDGGRIEFAKVAKWLDDLAIVVDSKSVSGLIQKLQEIAPEYAPSPELLSLCQFDRHDLFSHYRRAQVELFHTAGIDPHQPMSPRSVALHGAAFVVNER